MFKFFILTQLKNRKTIIIAILGIIPVGLSFILTIFQSFFSGNETSFFPNLSYILYLHFLMPITALFLGIGVIADEVEEQTLPYLIVRPVHRFKIVMTKYFACLIIGSIIIICSLFLSYSITALSSSVISFSSDVLFLLHISAILLLGLFVYGALFTLLGGTLRHPMVIGLLIVFGWEKLITYIPGNIRLFTVMSYLQNLYPNVATLNKSILFVGTAKLSNITAIIVLLGILMIFGGISFSLPSIKEYR